ncbi:DnaA ATPase domain-containing protein [Ligilactobacillus salivarius]|uniref:DnaA ATPase domain-containing protein n=1 Tax=Ligilactobacillus salivarius TaxID=1624 RepID=UPI003F23A8D4
MDNLGDAIKLMFAKHFVDVGACPQCGARLYVPKPKPDIGGACPTCGYIDSNNNVKRTDEDWTLEARKNDQINYFTSNSILPSLNIMSNEFRNMKRTPNLNGVLETAIGIANRMAKPNHRVIHSLFSGASGRGKTHTAISIINEVWRLTNYQYKFIFIDYPLFVSMQQQAINDKEAQKLLDRVMNQVRKGADCVVIDDLGTEPQMANDWNSSKFNEIMRYREDKDIIITTNLAPENIADKYNEQTMSRLRKFAKGNFINFKENIPDYRRAM